MTTLVIHVRLHDGRYHGNGDWPPSPARLFQALVAGGGLGGLIKNIDREALAWIESQGAPSIGAPPARQRHRGVLFYMPNNDSDSIEGDAAQIAKIRTATKVFRPYIFDASIPFMYTWSVGQTPDDEKNAMVILSLAERLYQLGRGIDMAWAWGEVFNNGKFDELLAAYPGQVFRPTAGNSGFLLACPGVGSLESIECRYQAQRRRFRYEQSGKSVKVVFRQPPKPRFQTVAYDSPPARQLYELHELMGDGKFAPWPLERVCTLIAQLRDGAVERLKRAMPARTAEIERVLVGRKPNGMNDGPTENRVRFVPLPSIGYVHADRDIRRVLVEVPSSCPIRADDVRWAFSGLKVGDLASSDMHVVLISADDSNFLRHYGMNDDGCHRIWRTVTPAALPESARRRRIDPAHKRDKAKAGVERALEQTRAAAAVCQALRHADVRIAVEAIRVQREPFEGKGARVEAFADSTRFDKHRLWHIEIAFAAPLSGPLIIGDGRFLGLGVMAPLLTVPGSHTFLVESGLVKMPDPIELARAFRRAVMARVQAVLGDTVILPPFFTGHEINGVPARSESNPHLFFLYMPDLSRLMVIPPHIVESREPRETERKHLHVLDKALSGFYELRAGSMGCLSLRGISIDSDTDSLFALSRVWESVTPYSVTRHIKQGSAVETLSADLRAECDRRGLPKPVVIPGELRGIPGTGLIGAARLVFPTAVRGPVILGKTRYLGGGLFVGRPRE